MMINAHGREFIKGVHEKHHILPKSLGGSNERSNIVCLTYREHFIAHWLLTKFVKTTDKKKMLHALWRMTGKSKFHEGKIIYSWQYSIAREAFVQSNYGNEYHKFRKRTRGWSQSDEWKAKTKSRMMGNKHGEGNQNAKGKNVGNKNGRAVSVICLNDGNIFLSRIEAANRYGIKHPTNISAVCNGKSNSCKGMKFAYYNE